MALKNITGKVADLMNRVMIEVNGKRIDYNKDHVSSVGLLSFMLAFDYFDSTLNAVDKQRIISAGSLLRSSLENMADIFYILSNNASKIESRSKAYVESIKVFREAMISASTVEASELAGNRMMNNVNQWTTSNISRRIGDLNLLTSYDLLSYFTHPNPGSVEYLVNQSLKEQQLNVIEQAVCVNSVHLIALMMHHSGIKSISESEIEGIARELGTSVFENPVVS